MNVCGGRLVVDDVFGTRPATLSLFSGPGAMLESIGRVLEGGEPACSDGVSWKRASEVKEKFDRRQQSAIQRGGCDIGRPAGERLRKSGQGVKHAFGREY